MMTSALDLIRTHYQGQCRLSVLARPEAVELLDGSPAVDEIIVYPYRSGSPFYGLAKLTRRLRREHFDQFISLDRRPRGALAAVIAGIKDRLGPDILFAGARPKFWTKILFTQTVAMTPEECTGSLVEMFQLVIRRGLGAEGRGRISLPPVTPERDRRALELIGPSQGRPVVGWCVKTNDPGKTWPASGFAALMHRFHQELGAHMYVTGGPGDRSYIEALLAQAPEGVVNLAGQTSLMDIPALASRSDLCLTLDNGAAHLMANSALKNLVVILMATKPKILVDSMPQAHFVSLSPGERDQRQIDQETEQIFQLASSRLRPDSTG